MTIWIRTMTIDQAAEALQHQGLSDTAAHHWATYLTRDGQRTCPEEIAQLVTTLKAKRQQQHTRRRNRPDLLTTPEERFGGAPGPNEP